MSDAVLANIRDLLPTFRAAAQQTEDARQVPETSIKALGEAGFFRLLQPVRFGGSEAHPVDFYNAIKLIASACGSTGWVASVLGAHAWHLATMEDQAQQDIWSGNPDALLSSAYAPVGRASAVEGGYRLSGHWNFSSGVNHAHGVLVGGLVIGADGTPTDYGCFLVPEDDYVVDDVWDTIGLRGTGSNDIRIEDAFVPAHRMLSMDRSFRCDVPGAAVNTNPIYRMPLFSIMATTITAPLIGMAEGAYDAHIAHQRERVRVYEGKAVKDDPFAKVRVAEAASEIDAAWLQMMTNVQAVAAAAAAAAGEVPMRLRAKLRRDQVRGAGRATFAIDRLFENSGARSIASGTPIQRFWRDAHAARVHVAHDPELPLKIFGDEEFGEGPVQAGML